MPHPQPVWIQFGIVEPKDMKLSGLSLAFWMEGHPDSYIYLIYLLILECVKKSHPNHNIDMRNEKHKTHQQNNEWNMEITHHNNNKYSFSLSSNSGFLFLKALTLWLMKRSSVVAEP